MSEGNSQPAPPEVQPLAPDEETLQILEKVVRWLAHQINNPLATMSGNAQLLDRVLGLDDVDPASSYSRAIRHEALRCSELLDNAVALCARAEPQPEPTDLTQVLDQALQHFVHAGGTEAVTVSREYAPSLPLLQADADLLRRAFEAVLENAAQALPDGGQVSVQTGLSSTPGFAEVLVTDNGEGIDEADLPRVTQPGFSTRLRTRGLGLTYCHRVLLAHGGVLRIGSQKGRGTVVRMLLPLPGHSPGR